MSIKDLHEELKQLLHELELDPSFKNYIDDRRSEQKSRDERELNRAKDTMDRYPDDEYWKKEYERELARYVGKHEADTILKMIYEKTHIDLQNGGIKEIPVPKDSVELKKILTSENQAMILKHGDRLIVVKAGVNSYLGRLEIYAAYSRNAGSNSSFRSDAYSSTNGKVLDLTNERSLSQAINKGLFDKAWLVYGGKTDELRRKRQDAYRGSDEDKRSRADSYNWHRDKSGYILRDLKKEFASMLSDSKKQNFDKVKESAKAIKKSLFTKIKENDIEDIDTKLLQNIITVLRDIEDTSFRDWDLDSMKNSQNKIETRIERLQSLVDSV